MPRKPTPDARDRILDTAARLFYEHGVHAVGLQQVIDECGCGKSMLYREFASKDELVVAWLERCRGTWDTLVDRAMSDVDDPAEGLVAIVRAAVAEVLSGDGRGCALRNTQAEFPDADHPAHQVSVAHMAQMRDDLRRVAHRTDVADPDRLADRVMLIIDGVYTNGTALGADGAAASAVEFAEEVVRTAPRR
jgi:AcrR family transcriptional regulator